MSIIVWAVLLIVFMWALTSGSTIVRYLARGLAVVNALVAAAAALGLMAVGHKANWTSDGPGMLLIMIGIPMCGIVAWFFGVLAFTTTTSSEETHLSGSSRSHAGPAKAWERYKESINRPPQEN